LAAFRSQTQLPVTVSIDPRSADIPYSIVRELVPLLREGLTNIEKHARASSVSIVSAVQDGHLLLTLQDDGIGIGASRSAPDRQSGQPRGHGLTSMRERAELLGGSLSVEPAAGGGTVITVSIPLPVRV
jgi:signal transduction histidine kinase